MKAIIKKLAVPKVILRYIMMNFTDLKTIKCLILNVKIMNVLDNYSKDILEKARRGFQWNCLEGHLIVAQWLYSLGGINIHADNEYAFKYSCQNGHLIVAQWLYSLGDVDIHHQHEYAFRASCDEGHLDVAQWLYVLGQVNIHAYNEEAFRWSCQAGHLAVAQWLYSLGGINIHADNKSVFKYSRKEILNWLNMIKN